MVAFLPIALAAAGALAAFQKNRQRRPILESNDRFGALLDIAGAGLGGFIGGSVLGGQGGGGPSAAGLGLGGLGALLGQDVTGTSGVDTAKLPDSIQGSPRIIPADQLPLLSEGTNVTQRAPALLGLENNILPGESGGIPDEVGGLQDIAAFNALLQRRNLQEAPRNRLPVNFLTGLVG